MSDGFGSTTETRAALAELLGVPVDAVLHYAIVARGRGGALLHRFCGLTADGIGLHAAAIHSMAESIPDFDASKLASGCSACGDETPDR